MLGSSARSDDNKSVSSKSGSARLSKHSVITIPISNLFVNRPSVDETLEHVHQGQPNPQIPQSPQSPRPSSPISPGDHTSSNPMPSPPPPQPVPPPPPPSTQQIHHSNHSAPNRFVSLPSNDCSSTRRRSPSVTSSLMTIFPDSASIAPSSHFSIHATIGTATPAPSTLHNQLHDTMSIRTQRTAPLPPESESLRIQEAGADSPTPTTTRPRRAFFSLLWQLSSSLPPGEQSERERENATTNVFRGWNMILMLYSMPLIAVSIVALNKDAERCSSQIFIWLAVQTSIFFLQFFISLAVVISASRVLLTSSSGPFLESVLSRFRRTGDVSPVDASIYSGGNGDAESAGNDGAGAFRPTSMGGMATSGPGSTGGMTSPRRQSTGATAVTVGTVGTAGTAGSRPASTVVNDELGSSRFRRVLLNPYFYTRLVTFIFITWAIVGVVLLGWGGSNQQCTASANSVYTTSFYIIVFHVCVIGLYCMLWCFIPIIVLVWLYFAPQYYNPRIVSRAASKEMVSHLPVKKGSDLISITTSRAARNEAASPARGSVDLIDVESGRASEVELSCAICLIEYEAADMVRVLPCSHYFHRECIDKWLYTDKSCPLCKHDIDQPWPPPNPHPHRHPAAGRSTVSFATVATQRTAGTAVTWAPIELRELEGGGREAATARP